MSLAIIISSHTRVVNFYDSPRWRYLVYTIHAIHTHTNKWLWWLLHRRSPERRRRTLRHMRRDAPRDVWWHQSQRAVVSRERARDRLAGAHSISEITLTYCLSCSCAKNISILNRNKHTSAPPHTTRVRELFALRWQNKVNNYVRSFSRYWPIPRSGDVDLTRRAKGHPVTHRSRAPRDASADRINARADQLRRSPAGHNALDFLELYVACDAES